MEAALITMLDNRVIVYVKGPASGPRWEVVRETNAVNVPKLRRYLGKLGFKSGVMVAQGPILRCLPRNRRYLLKTLLADAQLLFDRGEIIPADWGMAADWCCIQNVSVYDDNTRLKKSAKSDKCTMSGARKAGKVMSVRANQHNSIAKLNLFPPLYSRANLGGLLSIMDSWLRYPSPFG
jgi:hypothetical protein